MSPIQSITVRRFKRIQDVTVPLADVTILIGANNSGKSSVLQALHFAVSIAQSAKIVGEGVSWRNDAFELSFNPSQLLYAPVADVMSLANGGELQEARPSRVEIQLLCADGTACTVGLKRGRNRNIGVVVEGRKLGERLMDVENPFTIYAPGLAGIARDERYLSPGVVRRIVARGDANLALRNVLRMLRQVPAAWASFQQDMASIFPGIDVSVDFDERTDEHIEAYARLAGGPRLPIDAAGTSVLQASQILAYVGLFQPKVLILDEPDSHLHPDNQRVLCALICRLSEERDFQTVVSTHSRHVLDVMKDRRIVWMSKGAIVEGRDVNATQMLLDLGALDSVDYFADGQLKCVVATEDTDKEPLQALLWSCGFVEEDTEVASYAGCSKTDAAVVLGKFLKDKAPHVTVVVHRDRDYMSEASAKGFDTRLTGAGMHPFLTEHSDIEGYFLNAEHLNYLNPAVSVARMRELIDEATEAARDTSVVAMVNLRLAAEYSDLRGTGRSPDAGKIAVEAGKDHDADPAKHRRGKLVIGKLSALLQKEMKSNPRIFAPSPHLVSFALRAAAGKVWPLAPHSSDPTAAPSG
ncbi:MAG: AAA family ATPase [Polyangiaceae bacterium]